VIAQSLRGDFLTLLHSFPGGVRTASDIARYLRVPRPVCHRLVASIRRAGSSIELLLSLPGVKALDQIVAAAKARRCDAAAVACAERAVERYAALIERHGGSQAKLQRAVRLLDRVSDSGLRADLTEEDRRRSVFESARVICDRWCECKFTMAVLGPSVLDPSQVDHVGATGYLGLRAGPAATPLCTTRRLVVGQHAGLQSSPVQMHDFNDDAPMHGATPQAVLARFSSQPVARVTTRTRGAETDQLIEPVGDSGTDGVDLVIGNRATGGLSPRDEDPPIMNYGVLADAPPRTLMIALHLHRSIARDCTAHAGCYVTGTRGTTATRIGTGGVPECGRPSERWFDRLAQRLVVEYLGPGLEGVDWPGYSRASELYQHLLAAKQWDPADFVGFRCAVEYPVWNTEYLLSLDFTPSGEGGAR
jgi:hypothetical protein